MTNHFVGASLTETFTALQLEQGKGAGVGDIVSDSQGNSYVFVQFLGAVTPNFLVAIKAANTALAVTNTVALRGERVGVYVGSPAAANGDYGWVQIYGTVDVQVTASCAANAPLATTTTGGQISDASGVGTKQLPGIVLTTARAASIGLAPALLVHPTVGSTN
jgi:hypothetical protein